mmetsp:Transcript_9262/g.56402  ORF Transcript_9262/g.56402 Transcript_9262/m.56402 type:complete len:123 (+) Transcript_9262:755-1123(+)
MKGWREENGKQRHGPTLSFLRCGTRHGKEVMNEVESAAIDDSNPSTRTCLTIMITCWACPSRSGTWTCGGNLYASAGGRLRVSISQSPYSGKSSFRKEIQEPVSSFFYRANGQPLKASICSK